MLTATQGMVVSADSGRLGTVAQVHADGRLVVLRDDGTTLMLDTSSYTITRDGVQLSGTADQYATRQLSPKQVQQVEAGQTLRIPVVAEEVKIERRVVEQGGVRVHKHVTEREETVEQPTFREEVSVERVAIGRPIDAVMDVRHEGDTMIIPVVEEVLVVEKRLVLKEEIRVTTRRINETEQARVVLRSEEVEIEQLPNTATTQQHGGDPVA